MDNVNDNVSDCKPFKNKTKITGETETRPAQDGNNGDTNQSQQDLVAVLNVEVTISLK